LARESSTQDLVLRNRILGIANITLNGADIGVVQPIEFTEFGVRLTCEDTLVAEAGKGLVKSTESGEEVNESQS